MNMITVRQKAAIWTIVRKNEIDEEGFRDGLERDYGTRSTKKLTQNEAEDVIKSLKVFTGEEYRPHKMLRTWGITARQMNYAKRLVGELGWDDDPKRLAGFIKKMFYGKKLEQLNKAEGTKLIIGLEKILESGNSEH